VDEEGDGASGLERFLGCSDDGADEVRDHPGNLRRFALVRVGEVKRSERSRARSEGLRQVHSPDVD